MKKLLAILGPAIIAASSASIVNIKNINPYQNNEELFYNEEEEEQDQNENTHFFRAEIDSTKYGDETEQLYTSIWDETEALKQFVHKVQQFRIENNVKSIKLKEFKSKFYRTAFYGNNFAIGQDKDTYINLIEGFFFGKEIEILSQKVEIEKVDGYGNYSWAVTVSAIIDGTHYSNVSFDTYHSKQYFNAHQILGKFYNYIKVEYETHYNKIEGYDSEFNSNIFLKNLGFYWYPQQIVDSFNKWDYNKIALDYVNSVFKQDLPQIKAIGVTKAKTIIDKVTTFKPIMGPSGNYSDNTQIIDNFIYVRLESDSAEGTYYLLIHNIHH
ncbi:hypothetical protein [Spiroplasma sp. SV19]|uniref:hypothetical protein n=1 Tax=Spiroplasma sp. SV19 TaxID=2570468 RepID=UPI0024B84528|nr:hypothetical protein [Spiroplasma sp. SV19]WHQ36603.1 hypothetical protein E7Y35_01505 [Spiroplasma sp. SV19]